MVECGEVFFKILDEHAKADRVFRLEEEVRTASSESLSSAQSPHALFVAYKITSC